MDIRHSRSILNSPHSGAPSGSGETAWPARAALTGVVTALVTPMRSDRSVDVPAMERLIEGQVSAGVHALFVLGSVGEGPLLSDAQFALAARTCATAVGGRRLLLGGASDNSVERCLARLAVLAEAGVQAGVVTLPYYGWPARVEESLAFFRAIAEKSPLPIVAYDLPKAVGWQMPLELIESLFTVPNVIGLKSTHGDFAAMAAACESPRRPPGFRFLPGNSSFASRLYHRGADGVVCTPSNVFPRPFVAAYEAMRAGRNDLIAELEGELLPMVIKLLELLPTGAASIKAVLEAQGLAQRHTVPPWPEATDSDIGRAREALARIAPLLARHAPALEFGPQGTFR